MSTPCVRKSVLLGASLSVVGTGIATALAILGITTNATTDHVARLFTLTAGAMFLGAGVLRIARWRIVRDSRSLLTGTALIVLGGVSIPLTSLAAILTQGNSTSHLRAATAIVTTLVVMVLLVRALTGPPERELSAARVLVGACLAALGLFGLALMAHLVAPALLRTTMVDPPLIRGTVLAIAWFTLAYLAALASDTRPWAGRLAPLLACMCVSELLRINQVFLPGGWALACVVLLAIVAAFTAHRALLDLDEAAMAGRTALQETTEVLAETRSHVDAQHAWREELTHDARNALAGLRAALHTLERYGEELDHAVLQRLRSAAMGEVSHLEDMIIRAPQRRPVDFDIAEAIRSTVETRRAAGLQVEMHNFSWKAHGHPGDLATAVQNILVNTQRHAPGARARICVVPAGEKVHLYIADDGPGLTDEQAAHVFERGTCDATHGGSGLGMFVARSLIREQGGDVELRGHFEGAVFVVTLPAAKGASYGVVVELPQQRMAQAESAEPVGVTP